MFGLETLSWQEAIFLFGNLFNGAFVLPMILRRTPVPVITSGPVALTLALFGIAFLSWGAWFSVAGVWVCAALWLVLLGQAVPARFIWHQVLGHPLPHALAGYALEEKQNGSLRAVYVFCYLCQRQYALKSGLGQADEYVEATKTIVQMEIQRRLQEQMHRQEIEGGAKPKNRRERRKRDKMVEEARPVPLHALPEPDEPEPDEEQE